MKVIILYTQYYPPVLPYVLLSIYSRKTLGEHCALVKNVRPDALGCLRSHVSCALHSIKKKKKMKL